MGRLFDGRCRGVSAEPYHTHVLVIPPCLIVSVDFWLNTSRNIFPVLLPVSRGEDSVDSLSSAFSFHVPGLLFARVVRVFNNNAGSFRINPPLKQRVKKCLLPLCRFDVCNGGNVCITQLSQLLCAISFSGFHRSFLFQAPS